MNRFARVLPLLLGSFSFTVGLSAWAYIPPSQFVVRGMAAKRSGLKVLRVQSLVTKLDGAGKPSEIRFKEITVYDMASRTIRSIAVDDLGHELYRMERKLAASDPKPPVADKIDELLLAIHAEGLTGSLLQLGIPIRTDAELLTMKNEEERQSAESTQLQRWKSTFAWVIGKPSPRNPERPVSQLWVEKDSFLPLRLITLADGSRTEWNFENYRYFREVPFPRLITWIREDRPRARVEAIDVQVNGAAPELKAAPFEKGFTEAGNQADSGVRDLIQSYYEWIR